MRLALIAAGCATLTLVSAPSHVSASRKAHLITVKMIEKDGGSAYAFEPNAIDAGPGDTVRFLETGAVPHNVEFRKEPKGANLGDATTGPYLTTVGQTYDIVIDKRFTPGAYAFVCVPHESVGMNGTLTVRATQ